MTKRKRGKKTANNDLQNNAKKTKDWATRTSLKIGSELRCTGRVGNSCSKSGTRRVAIVTNPVINLVT